MGDTTDLVTADTMAVTTDTVWDTTDTDTVWDTVATTDTDIPVLTVMPTTTSARGLLMPNLKPKPKPKLILPLMLAVDTMAVDTDMAVTDTTVKKTVLDCNILPFFK